MDNALAMSTGADYQGSHWINGTQKTGLGIMNPTLGLKESWSISNNDLLAMDAMGWDVVYPAQIDVEALYNKAQDSVEEASIEDRTDDVDDILNTEAYNWSRRSSTSSGGSFWWSRRSSTSSGGSFWQVGYWSTHESALASNDNSADFDWQNGEYGETVTSIGNKISDVLSNSDWNNVKEVVSSGIDFVENNSDLLGIDISGSNLRETASSVIDLLENNPEEVIASGIDFVENTTEEAVSWGVNLWESSINSWGFSLW